MKVPSVRTAVAVAAALETVPVAVKVCLRFLVTISYFRFLMQLPLWAAAVLVMHVIARFDVLQCAPGTVEVILPVFKRSPSWE
jgi:hypothetical protein